MVLKHGAHNMVLKYGPHNMVLKTWCSNMVLKIWCSKRGAQTWCSKYGARIWCSKYDMVFKLARLLLPIVAPIPDPYTPLLDPILDPQSFCHLVRTWFKPLIFISFFSSRRFILVLAEVVKACALFSLMAHTLEAWA
jgi:hypothetical protein